MLIRQSKYRHLDARPALDYATGMRYKTWLSLGAALSLTACAAADSNDIDTHAIYADYSVTSNGVTSEVVAQLKVGGATSNTIVKLTGGDQLVAYNGVTSDVMSKRSNLFGDIEYYWKYSGDVGGTSYTITFERPSRGELVSSSASLPKDFEITSPAYGVSYTAAQNLPVAWTVASSEDMNINLSGSCGLLYVTALAGVTSKSIDLGGVAPLTPSSTATSCVMSVLLIRDRTNPVNAAFGEGGKFEATQKRSTAINFSY